MIDMHRPHSGWADSGAHGDPLHQRREQRGGVNTAGEGDTQAATRQAGQEPRELLHEPLRAEAVTPAHAVRAVRLSKAFVPCDQPLPCTALTGALLGWAGTAATTDCDLSSSSE